MLLNESLKLKVKKFEKFWRKGGVGISKTILFLHFIVINS